MGAYAGLGPGGRDGRAGARQRADPAAACDVGLQPRLRLHGLHHHHGRARRGASGAGGGGGVRDEPELLPHRALSHTQHQQDRRPHRLPGPGRLWPHRGGLRLAAGAVVAIGAPRARGADDPPPARGPGARADQAGSGAGRPFPGLRLPGDGPPRSRRPDNRGVPSGSGPEPAPGRRDLARLTAAAGVTHHRFGPEGLRLPEGGGRLRLETDRGPMELDLWEGDPRGLDPDQWRTLLIAVAILGFRMSRAPAA